MEQFLPFLIVCPLVFCASFIDSIAGGGGLISLPAYLLAGLPIHNAIATNKLSSTSGTLISTGRLVKNHYADLGLALPAIPASFLGSILGANIALHTSDQILKMVLLVILPIVAYYVLKKKDLNPDTSNAPCRRTQVIIIVIASFLTGIYDGFYGPGTGTFLLLIYTAIVKLDLPTASGNMKLANLSSNISALVTFILAGKVIWGLGLAAAVFSIGGHYVGSGMVMKNGTRIVRPIVLFVLILLFLKIISGLF